MSGRIRGHYRIDSSGRIEPMTDVNGAALKSHSLASALPNRRSSTLVRISIAGFVLAILGVGSMLALPRIQRAMIAAESAQYASVRRLHGHRMHEMASRLLRHDAAEER